MNRDIRTLIHHLKHQDIRLYEALDALNESVVSHQIASLSVELAVNSSETGISFPVQRGNILVLLVKQNPTGTGSITLSSDFMPNTPTALSGSGGVVTAFTFYGSDPLGYWQLLSVRNLP